MTADAPSRVSAVEYLPGDRWLIAGDAAVIQLAGASADALRWWPAVRADATATELIGQVYTDGVLGTGTSLAIVRAEGDAVRVLAQGEVTVVVETVAGHQVTVSGAGLLTWAEVVVPDAAVVYLDCPDALPDPGDLLPMPTGVVQAGPVRWQLVSAAAPPLAPAPAVDAPVDVGSADFVASDSVPVEVAPDDWSEPGADASDDAVTVIASVPVTVPVDPEAPIGTSSEDPVDDTVVEEEVLDDAVEEATAEEPAEDAGAEETAVPPGDVTQTVTEDELEELADGDPDGDERPSTPSSPFPSIALPPFTPPPFTTPQIDLPPVVPPPFVPASTSLPPISSVPGSAADSVPTGLPPQTEPTAPQQVPVESSDGAGSGDDASAGPVAAAAAGDHDGHTQLAESLPAGYTPPPVPPAAQPGEVYAAICPYGHANAPHSGNCRVCGSPIATAEPVLTARPLLGRIRLSSGPSVDVDRRIVIGRSPSVSRVASSDIPRLVTVPSPHQDISRSHVEIRAEDWHLVVADLHSTNGTLVRAPGRPDQLLHPGQVVVVEPGWAVDLGDGVSFVIEAAS